nr:TonB-dependent receptor plug domain-containing protein [uncultured Tenacibaculum sp.]
MQDFPSFNIGELAARQKGLDFPRSGVLGTGINIRGFNSAFNSKNLQMRDDRVSMLIATGLPYGSFSTVTKDDVERVEILLGPNGTLYGPNAHNGLVSTITKNPRTSEGTTIAIGAGSQNVVTGRLRHAQVLSDKCIQNSFRKYIRNRI